MVQKKFNTINWIGLLLTAASFIYLFVIYVIMFTAEPTFFAGRMYAGQFGSYAGKIIVCIGIFVTFLFGIVSLVVYTIAKRDGRYVQREKWSAIIIVACAVLNLILVIVFLALQGQVFDGRLSNAESTVYRIIDICVSVAAIGGMWMLVGYRPRYDRIKEIKKQRNKI